MGEWAVGWYHHPACGPIVSIAMDLLYYKVGRQPGLFSCADSLSQNMNTLNPRRAAFKKPYVGWGLPLDP